MNIKIRIANLTSTLAIIEYAEKKISSLEKFLPDTENLLCQVELSKTTNHHKSGDIFRAEVNITDPLNGQIFAFAEESDLYAAIDIVRDEAERNIVSKKTKRNTLFRRSGAKVKAFLKHLDIRPKRWR